MDGYGAPVRKRKYMEDDVLFKRIVIYENDKTYRIWELWIDGELIDKSNYSAWSTGSTFSKTLDKYGIWISTCAIETQLLRLKSERRYEFKDVYKFNDIFLDSIIMKFLKIRGRGREISDN